MTPNPYRKLTPRRRTFSGSYQMWMGEDHLLLVSRHWWTERYQRFRFADIQSIVVTERPNTAAFFAVGLFISIALGYLAAAQLASWGGRAAAASPFALAAIWTIVRLLRGRSCQMVLNTAVSKVKAGAVVRTRLARRVVEQLTAEIERVQGRLEGPVVLPEVAHTSAASVLSPELPVSPQLAARWLLGASAAAVGVGAFGWISFRVAIPQQLLGWGWMLGATLLALSIVALKRQSRSGFMARAVAILLVVGGGTEAVITLSAFTDTIIRSAQRRADGDTSTTTITQPRWLKPFANIENPALAAIGLIGVATALISQRKQGEQS